jgi:hypothetical protein
LAQLKRIGGGKMTDDQIDGHPTPEQVYGADDLKEESRKIELHWNQNDDVYLPTVTIFNDGSMQICCGGLCIVNPVREWHKLAKEISKLKAENDSLKRKLAEADEGHGGNMTDERKEEINLTQVFDGRIWAKEFMRIVVNSGKPIDEEWMFGWFANAIMAGYDNHRWKHEEEISKLKAENDSLKRKLAEADEGHVIATEGLLEENKKLIAEKEKLREIIDEYAYHSNRCILSFWEAGEATADGGYRSKYAGKWYQTKPKDETPKCTCGLDEVLKEAGK